MTPKTPIELARQIIKENTYLTLATTDGKTPWATPLAYISDDKLNLFFHSPKTTVHSRNISKNPNVSFAIFDSRQALGTGTGVQGAGTARMLDEKEINLLVRTYLKAIAAFSLSKEKYGVYIIEPTELYIPDDDAWNKEGIDRRLPVPLLK